MWRHQERIPSLAGIGVMVLVAMPATTAEPRATPVSPGDTTEVVGVASGCGTFSWTPVPGGWPQRLLVFEAAGAEVALAPGSESGRHAEEAVIDRPLPGGASSWTPPARGCLRPGPIYAWTIGSYDLHGKASWSEPLFFRVAGGGGDRASAAQEQGAALEPGLGAASVDGSKRRRESASSRPSAGAASTASSLPPPAVTLATADGALRAEQGDPTGETAGVLATAASPGGTGLLAANLNPGGGADLVLDGSGQSEADAVLSQSGIDRPSASDQTFDVRNTGGGGMTLRVGGADVLTAGGAIDATPIGATTAAAGTFTELTATSTVVLGAGTGTLTVQATNLALDALGELTVAGTIASAGAMDLSPVTGLDINIGAASSLDVLVDGVRELQVSSGGNINTGPNSAGRRNLRVSRVENDGAGLDLVLQAAGTGQVHINDTMRLDAGETIANAGSVVTFGGIGALAVDLGGATPELASPTGAVLVADTLLIDDVLRLLPIDSDGGGVSPACDAGGVGTLYYDADEESLCLCAESAGAPGFVTLPAGGACD